MPARDLANCLVIVVRVEESKPLVIEAFDSEVDVSRSAQWIASQPELLDLVARAYRLTRTADGTLDELNAAVGGAEGEDSAWLAAWSGLDAATRRRLLLGGDETSAHREA